MKIGIGFVGLAHVHLGARTDAVVGRNDIEILGAYDEDKELLGKFTSAYEVSPRSLDDLLNDDRIQLIYVIGRTYENPSYVVSAVEHRKNVLVEKPAAPDRKEMTRIVEAVERFPQVVRVGYTFEFWPTISHIKEILDSQMLGRITLARAHMGYPAGALLKDFFCWPHALGGVFFECGCHWLNFFLQFIGRPKKVSAHIKKYNDLERHPYEDVGVAILDFGDSLIILDLCGWEANDWGENHRLELYGTKGTLFISMKPPSYELYLKQDSGPFKQGWTIHKSPGYTTGYQEDLNRTLELIRRGEISNRGPLNRAKDVISIMEAIYQSSRENSRVVAINY